MTPSLPPPSERYLAVDSLRGLAALAVALFHLHVQSFQGVDSPVLHLLSAIFQYGYLGVPIFFVISGFVIGASVKPPDVSFHYIGKFAIKRSARLDPPYWLSIAVEIALVYLTIRLFHIEEEIPTLGHVIAHLFYAQNLLGKGDIAANYWTLCLEVQFYIFLALVFACANSLRNGTGTNTGRNFTVATFVLTGLFSLLIAAGALQNLWQGVFLSHWYLFLLGAACYWASIARSISNSVFFGYCVLCLVVFVIQLQDNHYVALNTLLALITALFLYAAAAKRKMSSWLNHRVLLYLGSISYSLYLFHAIIADRFISFIRRWLLPRLDMTVNSTAMALLLFAAAIAVAIIASHLVHTLVEKPSFKFSKRIKPASSTSVLTDIRNQASAANSVPGDAAVRPVD